MVRVPCCEKMGLKKGPWTPQEDQILIGYIQQHGHGNWRALPKQAGLMRCGKSCRLRWINYLRPDIKRGNFSKEEEETIIKLHQMLGNRWSAIAASLPGRTDNEIKNVWHTYLKKKLNAPLVSESMNSKSQTLPKTELSPSSPQHSSSELSSVTVSSPKLIIKHEKIDVSEYFPEIDETFWSEEPSDSQGVTDELQCQLSTSSAATIKKESVDLYTQYIDNGMDFWYNLFIRAGDLSELPEF